MKFLERFFGSCAVISFWLRYAAPLIVDIHSHSPPGINDGAESMEFSCAIEEMAIVDRITHVISSLHASQDGYA
jgi:hypothetical protein